ncbi:succinylglutamate desuccinylase/aspartoacylase family protein [Marinobacter daepoensis]|uniref:succinylglutamate desuccinylase/aspartoacylase family protein n=1 Tax=Marinobacter daepoensis TaxID=262077 RepID=UPI001C978D84|nr:succinylglutamate desuccinylase/aspartoacylase family protein [Marinobacter daepoensis]MBY6034492.1 succinylglutamate desuccinylase/aspartoacylase family protein [Marinobacter daepoensis]
MLQARLRHSTTSALTLLIVALATPGALADVTVAKTKATTLLVAELAEDESVEDIERSEPRRDSASEPARPPAPDVPAPVNTETSAIPADKPREIAPNIDLKEVAPLPEPEPALAEDRGIPVAPDAPPAEHVAPEALEPEPAAPVPAESFTLLGKEILPGTATRLAWSPGIQIAGLSQITPVLVVNGVNKGPTLCLTAAVHGDELNGIEIVRRTMYDLNPEKLSGRVIGVPIVNLTGFQQGSRYLPDRRDLNRHFPGSPDGTLADRIAHSLFNNVVRHCNMLVDIHTGSLKRTNLPQLRADMNHPDVAEFTRGFDRMAVVHSSGSPGMLRSAATDAGIRAVTLEAGESLRIQEHQIDAGVNGLNSLMEKHGMISRMFVWGDPEPVYYDSTWIRAQHGGILFSEIKLGATVSEGDILGYVADPITNEQHPIRATADGRVIGMAVDQVVMAGFAAYHIGTEAQVPGE